MKISSLKFEPSWNLDTIIGYLAAEGGSIETDNDGQILIYTDLYLWSDRALHDKPEREDASAKQDD